MNYSKKRRRSRVGREGAGGDKIAAVIIYLHGLNSSAQSEKAALTEAYCLARGIACAVPTLHHQPAKAAEQITALLAEPGEHTLIGSSMGGYYATWFCEQEPSRRAVLINPAVRLADKVADLVGKEQRNYNNGETYKFGREHLQEFKAMEVEKITAPHRYFLLAQRGDEVLDYREAVEFYHGARHLIEDAGNHSFVGYAAHLPAIVAFAEASTS